MNESEKFTKVPFELMDNISQFNYKLSDKISPSIYRKNITPNMITLFRALLGILSISLIKKNKVLSAILVILFHFLDCLDGHHARKNNMVTKFGDYFDHFVDISIGLSLVVYLYPKVDKIRKIVGGVILFFMLIYLGCEQKYILLKNKNVINDESLTFIQYFCPTNDPKRVDLILRLTKMFSIGAFITFLASCILSLK